MLGDPDTSKPHHSTSPWWRRRRACLIECKAADVLQLESVLISVSCEPVASSGLDRTGGVGGVGCAGRPGLCSDTKPKPAVAKHLDPRHKARATFSLSHVGS
uniref:Uncharacterized protein n=1 Tax=Knipowitschia caucasica TaxID=637954 RepID=A0AAV2J8X2_KNICA